MLGLLRIAFLNVLRYRTLSLLNIAGLTVGFVVFFLIFLYVTDELKFDRHHSKASRIYRIVTHYDYEGVGEKSTSAPFPMANAIKKDFADDIETSVRLFNFQAPSTFVVNKQHRHHEKRFFFTDSTIFNVFDFEFVQGSADTALNGANRVVITQSAARRYFDNEDPIGKTLRLEGFVEMTVTGVVRDVKPQSHFKFDFLASMLTAKRLLGGQIPTNWLWNPCWTYIVLKPNASADSLQQQLPAFVKKYFPAEVVAYTHIQLQKLTDIHLRSHYDYEIESNGNILYIYALSAIAFFNLLIAFINYMNLATAGASRRAKEIAVKKSLGASRLKLVGQFVAESTMLCLVSAFLALVLVELALPMLNQFTDKNFIFRELVNIPNIILVLILILVSGITTGIYPALYLSSFDAIKIFRKSFETRNHGKKARKLLVTAQFTIAIGLSIATVTIFTQLHFLRNNYLGFDKENILVIPTHNNPIVSEYEDFKSVLLENKNIESVTGMFYVMGVNYNTRRFTPKGFPQDLAGYYPEMQVRHDFLKTFGINLLAGRDFSASTPEDMQNAVIVNEAMIRHLGLTNPQEALGKEFHSILGKEKVIGVMPNFNIVSLHQPITPFVLHLGKVDAQMNWATKYIAIRLSGEYTEPTLQFIKRTYRSYSDRPMESFFLSDALHNLYNDEELLSTLSLVFTLCAIFVASLGILGLTSFLVEQHTKEIGIRKTFGASATDIIRNLSSEFAYLALIAIAIAVPISFAALYWWLHDFAHAVSLNPLVFAAAVFAALLPATILSIYRLYRAATANPIYALRHE